MVLRTMLGIAAAGLLAAPVALAQPTVIQSSFVTGVFNSFDQQFNLNAAGRFTRAQIQTFLIGSGLNAVMSNGQRISDVATVAPANFNPPYFNPFFYHDTSSGGFVNFAPATSPLEIDEAALNAAMSARAAAVDVIRVELIRREGSVETVVLRGDKNQFQFAAIDFGSGVSFGFRWSGVGADIAGWYSATATYSVRISAGGDPLGACCRGTVCAVEQVSSCTPGGIFLGANSVCAPPVRGGVINACCPTDFNNSGVVSVQDIFDFLSAYFTGCP